MIDVRDGDACAAITQPRCHPSEIEIFVRIPLRTALKSRNDEHIDCAALSLRCPGSSRTRARESTGDANAVTRAPDLRPFAPGNWSWGLEDRTVLSEPCRMFVDDVKGGNRQTRRVCVLV